MNSIFLAIIVGSSLKSNRQIDLSFSKSLIHSVCYLNKNLSDRYVPGVVVDDKVVDVDDGVVVVLLLPIRSH